MTTTPGNLAQVDSIMDPEVEEGHQAVLVNGIPEAQLCCDVATEPVQDVQAIAQLGRGGHSQEFDRADVTQQRVVRVRGRMVELIDLHGLDTSRIIIEVTETAVMEQLVNSLDVLTRLRLKGVDLSLEPGESTAVTALVSRGGSPAPDEWVGVGVTPRGVASLRGVTADLSDEFGMVRFPVTGLEEGSAEIVAAGAGAVATLAVQVRAGAPDGVGWPWWVWALIVLGVVVLVVIVVWPGRKT